jgi:concentrative nucleoside transporter, CNT family
MEQYEGILRGILGMFILLLISYLLSSNRKAINWRTIGVGLFLQFFLAVLILKVPIFKHVFDSVAAFFVTILNFSQAGASFVLGNWPDVAVITDGASGTAVTIGYVFAFKVLPTILFFSALSSVLYYLGILQIFIKAFGWLMSRTMKLTGAESMAAAANIFIGQTEAPLVVKPYIANMSKSEIMCLMTGGMATIAGSVFAAYVGFLGGSDPEKQLFFATHLLTASIISAPAAIVCAKILFPEEDKDRLNEHHFKIDKADVGKNLLDSITKGTTDGIKLAINVGAMLLVFTAMVALLDYILMEIFGDLTGLNVWVNQITDQQYKGFNLEFILGILFSPFAWLLGVESADILIAGQMLGLKTTLNEFYAYASLEGVKNMISSKSVIILTYALCGFANFASIGIQIGGISAIAPNQRGVLTDLGLKSLIAGTFACFLTAIIAGMLYQP